MDASAEQLMQGMNPDMTGMSPEMSQSPEAGSGMITMEVTQEEAAMIEQMRGAGAPPSPPSPEMQIDQLMGKAYPKQ